MSDFKFKIGDLVTVHTKDFKFLSNVACIPFIGGVCRIKSINDGFAVLSVNGRFMNFPVESLRKLQKIELFFMPEERQTLAVSYFEGNTRNNTVARCHPDDKYDVYAGADVALRRLLGKADNQPKNGEIKKNDMLIVTGKRALFDVGTIVKALEDERDYLDYVKCFGYSSTYNCLKSYLVEKKYLAKVVDE